jgi:NAD(P)-dependent dehydrogenase (short-subunit alcohol dehydrogenase family)
MKKSINHGWITRGIGNGIAEAFAKEGADLVINYFSNEQKANDLKATIESQCKVQVEI